LAFETTFSWESKISKSVRNFKKNLNEILHDSKEVVALHPGNEGIIKIPSQKGNCLRVLFVNSSIKIKFPDASGNFKFSPLLSNEFNNLGVVYLNLFQDKL